MGDHDYKHSLSIIKMMIETGFIHDALDYAERELELARRDKQNYYVSQFAAALAMLYSQLGRKERAAKWSEYAESLQAGTESPRAAKEGETLNSQVATPPQNTPQKESRKQKTPEEIDRDFAELERRYLKKQAPAAGEEEGLGLNEELLAEAMAELDQLVGLATLKAQIKGLVNFLRIQLLRKERGLKSPELSNHLVFTGKPGTGKTTVARIMGKVYHALGMLPTDKVTETDREGLVGKYVGHTAVKTNQVIDRALGGVLFIDEAYALNSHSKNDYGQEAISTLLKRMEDERGELVVIVAGYPEEMKSLLKMNPGLSSRFTHTIDFPAFEAHELTEIFTRMAKASDYVLSAQAREKLEELFKAHLEEDDPHFGNGRFVRNCYQETLVSQASRLMEGLSADTDLSLIEAVDIQSEMPKAKPRVGFGA